MQVRTLLETDLLILDDLFLARRISDACGKLLQSLVHQPSHQVNPFFLV